MSRVICVLVVVLMSAISTVGVCEQTPVESGQQDAQRDVYRPKWFFAGCLSGTFFRWIFDGNAGGARRKKTARGCCCQCSEPTWKTTGIY